MKLTHDITELRFPGRRRANEGNGDQVNYQKMEELFNQYEGKLLQFRTHEGEVTNGTLVQLFPEGMLGIQTEDGEIHEVSASDVKWR